MANTVDKRALTIAAWISACREVDRRYDDATIYVRQGAEQLRSPGRSLCSPGKADAEALACTASAPTSSAIGLDFLSREERREDPHGLQGARQRGLWPDLSHLAVMNRCHRMRRRGWQTKHLGEASEIPMSSTRHFHAYDERWMSPSSALAYRAAVAVTTGGSSFLIRTKKTQRHLLGHLGALSGWLHTSRHIAASASSS